VRQELTLTANLLGGYDENVTAGLGSGSATAPEAMASGGTAYVDGTLDYFRGNARHSIQVGTTGSLVAYPGYLDGPAPGAIVNIAAMTTAGRSSRFRFSERAGYESLFNVYSQGPSSVPLPPDIASAAPATGLFERRSVSSYSLVGFEQRWGQRDWTSLSYSYGVQEFTEDDYGDGTSHEAQARYRRGLSTGVRALVEYRYRDSEYADAENSLRPTREHRVEAGPEIEKVLSRRRRITFSLTAGAAHFESIDSTSRQPYEAWLPIGSAALDLALSPVWNVEGGYRRDLSTFQGVTDEIYAIDTAFLSTGGLVAGGVDLRVGASYGNWRTQVESGVNDTMDVYGASLQLGIPLSSIAHATASYYYYYHRYSNPASLPEGFPAEYDRHAIRVGLSLQVPIARASLAPRQTSR
jgi:hypothetical protein